MKEYNWETSSSFFGYYVKEKEYYARVRKEWSVFYGTQFWTWFVCHSDCFKNKKDTRAKEGVVKSLEEAKAFCEEFLQKLDANNPV